MGRYGQGQPRCRRSSSRSKVDSSSTDSDVLVRLKWMMWQRGGGRVRTTIKFCQAVVVECLGEMAGEKVGWWRSGG